MCIRDRLRAGGHAYNVVNYHGEVLVVDAQKAMVAPWSEKSGHPDLENVNWKGLNGSVAVIGWDPDNQSLWN